MPLVKCRTCGRQEGESEWFKSAKLVDKCVTCKKEEEDTKRRDFEATKKKDEEASKLKHERELEKIEKSSATRKDEVTHKKNAEIEIIDRRGEKAAAVAKIKAEVELEKVRLLRESDERKCKIVQDMIQSGQCDPETVRSLLASLTIQFTPVDSASLNEQETNDDELNIGNENTDD